MKIRYLLLPALLIASNAYAVKIERHQPSDPYKLTGHPDPLQGMKSARELSPQVKSPASQTNTYKPTIERYKAEPLPNDLGLKPASELAPQVTTNTTIWNDRENDKVWQDRMFDKNWYVGMSDKEEHDWYMNKKDRD